MLVSTPPANSHQLTNSFTSSNTLRPSFSTSSLTPLSTSNPCTWTIRQVKEWLIKHDLNDCIDLICYQHRMNGQRLMNLREDDVFELKGTNKNNDLWLQIKKLQQFYSSNYHLWIPRQTTAQQQLQQSLPMTTSSYFTPSPLQTTIPLRPLQSLIEIRPTSSLVTSPPTAVPSTQSQTSVSSSSHTTIQMNKNEQQQNPSISSPTTNQTETATLFLERSPSTITRSTNNQQYHRRSSSHSLSTSNTSIDLLLPSSSSTTTTQRPTNTLLNPRRTPADQIEDQPMTGCCFVSSIRSDRKKTLSACLLALSTLYFCSFIITIVDERLPDPKNFPPLPDLILDNVKLIPWAFSVTEKIIVIEMVTLITVIGLHRHR